MKTLIRVTILVVVIAANLLVGLTGSSSPQAFSSCNFQISQNEPPPGYVFKGVFSCDDQEYILWMHPVTGATSINACTGPCRPHWPPVVD